jgi:hypothetical protein
VEARSFTSTPVLNTVRHKEAAYGALGLANVVLRANLTHEKFKKQIQIKKIILKSHNFWKPTYSMFALQLVFTRYVKTLRSWWQISSGKLLTYVTCKNVRYHVASVF